MGYSILELVLRRLREEGFRADAAYPGQKFPQIEDTVATVHIEKVDRDNMTVTMEVSIICPAAMGGTACEVEALRATEILRLSGAVCVQNGCTYDGISQVYVVTVLAEYTGVTDSDSCTIWPGFYCYVADYLHRFAVAFISEESTGVEMQYVTGEAAPAGYHDGSSLWEIQLEELIPVGSAEIKNQEGEFTLRIVTDLKTETYSGCRWTSIRRQLDKQGLRRIRKGYALQRKEE